MERKETGGMEIALQGTGEFRQPDIGNQLRPKVRQSTWYPKLKNTLQVYSWWLMAFGVLELLCYASFYLQLWDIGTGLLSPLTASSLYGQNMLAWLLAVRQEMYGLNTLSAVLAVGVAVFWVRVEVAVSVVFVLSVPVQFFLFGTGLWISQGKPGNERKRNGWLRALNIVNNTYIALKLTWIAVLFFLLSSDTVLLIFHIYLFDIPRIVLLFLHRKSITNPLI